MANNTIVYPPQSNVTTTPVLFNKNGVPTQVNEDTVTPANNIPLPVEIRDTSGNVTAFTANGLKVDASGATQPVSGTVDIKDSAGLNLNSNGSGALKVDGSLVTQPVSAASLPLPTGAATSAKQPALGTAGTASADVITVQGIASMTALKVDGSAVTQPVSAASLPLPTGAATSALQTQISGQLPGTLGAHLTAASLAVNIASDQTVPVSAASLPLPTGAATSALQTTGNTSLSSIDGKLATLGQKTMAGSEPVVIASDQSAIPTSAPINANGSASSTTVSTVATITKPANAVGFMLQNDAASTDYIRWCDSNSSASTTVGFVLQPGQDSGFVPMSHNLSICAHSGTQNYNIQWVLSS